MATLPSRLTTLFYRAKAQTAKLTAPKRACFACWPRKMGGGGPPAQRWCPSFRNPSFHSNAYQQGCPLGDGAAFRTINSCCFFEKLKSRPQTERRNLMAIGPLVAA